MTGAVRPHWRDDAGGKAPAGPDGRLGRPGDARRPMAPVAHARPRAPGWIRDWLPVPQPVPVPVGPVPREPSRRAGRLAGSGVAAGSSAVLVRRHYGL